MESKNRRASKSLSDLAGADVQIHDGNVKGVFRELGNSLISADRQPAVQQMQAIYRDMRTQLPEIQRRAGGRSVFAARVFYELSVLATALARAQLSATAPEHPPHQ